MNRLDLEFSVKEAIDFEKDGRLEEWVHEFLCHQGNNKPFSDGLKLQQRFWMGPIPWNVGSLKRCCGPESGLKFFEPNENFDKRVNSIIRALKEGEEMPPLIVCCSDGEFELNDGNHRHEAYLRAGIEKCWVIFWNSESREDLEEFLLERSRAFI